ncbi:MAG: acylphosphatase [Alphaproteobacteria bacterium]|nr:acylphosphatase [Alphaproteobacteria bacterium]
MMHIYVSGRVQGIGFRAWACRKAAESNLSGWVRNRRDGRVELLADGDAGDVRRFLLLCRQGPMLACVDKVEPVSAPNAPLPPVAAGHFTIQATI